MRVTVLGKSPSYTDAGGACSGYLVEEDDVRVLLDCGNGVFGKMRKFVDYVDVDAVVLSHLHADHFLDLGRCSTRRRAPPRSSAGSPAPGARRTSSRRRSTCASTTRPTCWRSGRCACASTRCRTSCRTPTRSSSAPPTAAGA